MQFLDSRLRGNERNSAHNVLRSGLVRSANDAEPVAERIAAKCDRWAAREFVLLLADGSGIQRPRQHGFDDIPVTLIGGAAGRLKPAGGVVDAGPQTYHRLGCTMLDLMGAPSPGFGEEAACGVLQGLTLT